MEFSRKISALASFIAPLLLISHLAAADAPDGSIGVIAALSGSVMVRRALQTAASTAPAHAAQTNEQLYNGDVISTGGDGTLKMMFSDDSIIDLGPASMFKVDRFEMAGTGRKAFFTVLYGSLRALVTKAVATDNKFEIRTPGTSMGVRGTEFVVNAPLSFSRGTVGTAANAATRTEVTVMSGAVDLSIPKLSNAPISLTAGHQINAVNGATALPSAVTLSKAELTNVGTAARVADNTFVRTVTVGSSVQNRQAPAAATPRTVALANAAGNAKQAVSEDKVRIDTKAVGVFTLLNTISNPPVVQLPGNFKSVGVTFSH